MLQFNISLKSEQAGVDLLERAKEKKEKRETGSKVRNIIFKQMGSTDSIPQNNEQALNRDNWEEVRDEENQCSNGHHVHLKNKMTAEELDEYQIDFTDSDEESEYHRIMILRGNCEAVVKIAYFNEHKINQYCSLYVQLRVYIEHFPLRLSNLQAIPFPENTYVLSRALTGFKYLYYQLGYFTIFSDLICINQEGIIKVWVNSNLCNFFPEKVDQSGSYNPYIRRVDGGTENSMVWQLLIILDKITIYPSNRNTISFIKYLEHAKITNLSFESVQRLMESYVRLERITIPEVFESAIKLMREKKGIFDSQIDINAPRNRDESGLTIQGARFRESKVERVQSLQNQSLKSYNASESNRTFADKLKTFDYKMKKNNYYFGGNAEEKDSPWREPSLMLEGRDQMTDRLNIIKQRGSLSASASYSQSLITMHGFFGGLLVSEQHSIIDMQRQKNTFRLSLSPDKEPQTYFSQYFDKQEKQKIVETVNQLKIKAKHKKVEKFVVAKNTKPVVKFTYLPKQMLERLSEKSEIQSNRSSSQDSSMPFSPPSTNKRDNSDQIKIPEQFLKMQKIVSFGRPDRIGVPENSNEFSLNNQPIDYVDQNYSYNNGPKNYYSSESSSPEDTQELKDVMPEQFQQLAFDYELPIAQVNKMMMESSKPVENKIEPISINSERTSQVAQKQQRMIKKNDSKSKDQQKLEKLENHKIIDQYPENDEDDEQYNDVSEEKEENEEKPKKKDVETIKYYKIGKYKEYRELEIDQQILVDLIELQRSLKRKAEAHKTHRNNQQNGY